MSQGRVLLVTYYFPPLGGAGIGRPLALFSHLPEFGFECDVLTVKPVLYRAYESELLGKLEQSRIYRSGSYDPSRLFFLLGIRNVTSKTADDSRSITGSFFPDAKAGWIRPAVRLGKKVLKRNKYDLILSTSPPISAHVVARELSMSEGIPWVADFRDYWTSYKAEDYFSGSEKNREKAKRLLNNIRESASELAAVNESVAGYVGAGTVIANCYDAKLAKRWGLPESKEKFTVGVFGSFNELTPIYPLLNVLKSLKTNEPEKYSRIGVLQVGRIDEAYFRRELEREGLAESFDLRGFQTRGKAVEILSEAGLFYLGVSELGYGLTTGRIFTLLSSGRPMLAYAEAGSELDKIMSYAGSSFVFNDYKIEEARRFLSKRMEDYFGGRFAIEVEPEGVRGFSSERMAGKFGELIEGVLRLVR